MHRPGDRSRPEERKGRLDEEGGTEGRAGGRLCLARSWASVLRPVGQQSM